MQILDNTAVKAKIKRIALEICEHNTEAKQLYLVGINNNGYNFAKLLLAAIKKESDSKPELVRVKLNPAKPIAEEITLDRDIDFRKSSVVLVDDVSNTGRTLFYALQPIMQQLPNSVQVAVLIERQHKSFPIAPDFVGLSLATTIQEHIEVELGSEKMGAFLQ